jgi:hypothetical protein
MVPPQPPQKSSVLSHWWALMVRVETAQTTVDALKSAAEAKGYLECLYDVGLVDFYHHNKMKKQIEDACDKKLELFGSEKNN